LLRKAISVDPAFALAYWELKKVAQTCNDPTAVRDYARKMQEHISRLPERKQLMAQAEEIYSEDPAEAARLLEELLNRYPTEEDAYVSLSHSYLASHQVDKHMSLLERGVSAIPSSGYLRLYYGYGLLRSGRYPEAIRQFEAYARINPKEPNPYDSLGETYLIAGLPERAVQEYGKALEIDPTFGYSNLGRAWAYSSLGDFDQALNELSAVGPHLPAMKGPSTLPFVKAFMLTRIGRYAEADDEIHQGLESMAGDAKGIAKFHLLHALSSIEKGDYQDALDKVESAKLHVADDDRRVLVLAHFLSGVARARIREIASAREHLSTLNELADLQHPTEKWWRHLLEGEIALASGDPSAAESAFSAGEPEIVAHFSNAHPFKSVFANLSFRDGPARARKARGDVEGAIALYRQLIRPDISQKWTSALEPRHVLELARLLEKKGDTNGSLEQYRYFLELWKHADEGLPELEEARSRVTS
jgi:tetratricopeptide (TPR) repeat protein